jgi:hypothetical protein
MPLARAKVIDAERRDNTLLLGVEERALTVLSNRLKEVSLAKPHARTPEEKIRRQIDPLEVRLRCWRALAKHHEHGTNQTEHDFLNQCLMTGLNRKEKIDLDDVLRAVNKDVGLIHNWSYTKVGKSV